METTILLVFISLAVSSPLLAFADSPELPSEMHTINAAGATFPYPLIDLWRIEIAKETSDRLQLNYQSIGSGGGVQQHIAKTVNFAASDAPLRVSESKLTPGTLHIPESIGGVVVAYNIPEIPDSGLKLDGDTIVKIYLGEITKWNDENIAKDNPGITLPDEDIIPVRRSDGSGTTFVFTDYLTAVSTEFDEIVGKSKSVQWPARTHGAAGNEGVAGIIRSTEYTIGYIELAYAFQTSMSYAHIKNADGTAFIEPSLESISAASKATSKTLPSPNGDWSRVSLVNMPGSESYPIASFTYLLVYDEISQTTKSKEQAQAVVYMIHWMLTKGQEFAPQLLYTPISDEITEIGMDALSQITYKGESLWNYESDKVTLPDWFRIVAQFWIKGEITDAEYIDNLQYLISKGILQVDN
ncbi:MAG: phosphate ABC transporter, periplasmic phosphate-binding protein [Cenarchaeum symbiont of Oopsacas minuta]|nr:phosphate ABC transporter, periplasmic phosphate-binding protein [Cenarchaeum symbiont of Oopsacas minuta]